MTYVFTYNAKCLQGNDFLSKIILKNIYIEIFNFWSFDVLLERQ